MLKSPLTSVLLLRTLFDCSIFWSRLFAKIVSNFCQLILEKQETLNQVKVYFWSGTKIFSLVMRKAEIDILKVILHGIVWLCCRGKIWKFCQMLTFNCQYCHIVAATSGLIQHLKDSSKCQAVIIKNFKAIHCSAFYIESLFSLFRYCPTIKSLSLKLPEYLVKFLPATELQKGVEQLLIFELLFMLK